MNSNIEVFNTDFRRGCFKFAVFDFDGTISLIRQGWQEIMKSYFLEELSAATAGESAEALTDCVNDFVDHNTGKQTIYQCIALHDEIKKRNGQPADPQLYKDNYHNRLMEKIEYRLHGLMDGSLDKRDWVVPGSYEILDALRAKGIALYLASGTDECYVLDEASLLDVDKYFDGIYGAQKDYKTFSKKMVIERIVKEHSLTGPELIGFGDGYVEIENINEAGGFTVGVASDEQNRTGIDLWKRQRLISAGAHIIIPDYQDADSLISYLF